MTDTQTQVKPRKKSAIESRPGDIVKMELATYHRMRAELIQMCPDLEDDEVALLDTLEGETNLNTVLTSLARAAEYRKAQAAAMKDLLTRYSARRSAHNAASDAIRDLIRKAMVESHQDGVKNSEVTLSVRRLDPIIQLDPLYDINMVPDIFIKETVVKSLNMEEIQKALDNKVDLDFIVIQDDRYSLTVRI